MKLDKSIIKGNVIIFVILGIFPALIGGGTGIGAIALLLGFINIIAGLIKLLIGGKDSALTMLLYGGVLLLIGFSFCSAYPLYLNVPMKEE